MLLAPLAALTAAMPAAAQGGTACLQGQVFDGPGSPLPGARVSLPGLGLSGMTDATGRFAFARLPADTLTVRVIYIGYKSAVVSGLRIPKDSATAQDFRLEQSAVVVSSSGGGQAPPLGQPSSEARPVVPPALPSSCPATLPRVRDGRNPVVRSSTVSTFTRGNAPGGNRTSEGNHYVDGVPVNGVQQPSGARPALGRVEGRVLAIGRQPLWGAQVYIVGSRAAVTTDTNGYYRFDYVPAGVITVQAMVAGSNPGAVPGVVVRAGGSVTQDIVLTPPSSAGNNLNRTDGTRPEITFVDAIPYGVRPDSSPGRVDGTIRDGANRALANAVVVVVGTMETARTDSAGRYSLPLVPSGTRSLGVTREGFAPALVEGLRLGRGETVVQDFQLLPAGPSRP
jgi:hypothetical protein